MITKSDVVAQFKDLHRKCYTHNGYLVSTVPDEDSERVFANAKWHECYNKYASEHTYIYSMNCKVKLFGCEFVMTFDRPIKQDHHWEFENYFGFGGHCNGFNNKRTVAHFPSGYDKNLNIDDILLKDDEPIDATYAKDAITMLALGGYVKNWNAVYEFEKWFVERGLTECNDYTKSKKLLMRIFEIMEPQCIENDPVEQKPPSDPVFITSSDDGNDDDGNDDDGNDDDGCDSNMERLLLRALDYVDPRDLES